MDEWAGACFPSENRPFCPECCLTGSFLSGYLLLTTRQTREIIHYVAKSLWTASFYKTTVFNLLSGFTLPTRCWTTPRVLLRSNLDVFLLIPKVLDGVDVKFIHTKLG